MLLSGASLAALPWLGRNTVGAAVRRPSFSSNPFQLGVASGDPASDGVVLWTRLATDPLNGGGMLPENYSVKWEVASDDGFQKIVQSGTELATPQMGHSVHVELSGLKPDSWYWYRFQVGDAVSRTGKTRTMPDQQADACKIAVRLCFLPALRKRVLHRLRPYGMCSDSRS